MEGVLVWISQKVLLEWMQKQAMTHVMNGFVGWPTNF